MQKFNVISAYGFSWVQSAQCAFVYSWMFQLMHEIRWITHICNVWLSYDNDGNRQLATHKIFNWFTLLLTEIWIIDLHVLIPSPAPAPFRCYIAMKKFRKGAEVGEHPATDRNRLHMHITSHKFKAPETRNHWNALLETFFI